MSEDGILLALGYSVNDATVAQLRGILSKCDFEDNELDRIVGLNDKLKIYGAHVAMSNSNPYFKIKNDATNEERKTAVEDIISVWSEKFKLKLQKVAGKETYYVLGRQISKN